jgi:hypothetical protein
MDKKANPVELHSYDKLFGKRMHFNYNAYDVYGGRTMTAEEAAKAAEGLTLEKVWAIIQELSEKADTREEGQPANGKLAGEGIPDGQGIVKKYRWNQQFPRQAGGKNGFRATLEKFDELGSPFTRGGPKSTGKAI